ncbi:hypothetical protein BD289DRAFT_473921 [Coniella lustricola]|uniref:Uncharacterized protein n=1 Tax=Coniella lustricola TaxID=2025994 RepID=A0A2T3A9D9_9PEZI|nr:hypothetical protein BD289DRAFT_473921 [Coniella lustricola]
MCIVFTCGEHTFRKQVEGYEGIVCQCHNCGNHSGHVIKSHPWFTLCFIPVVPLSFHGYVDIVCNVCNFAQPLDARPDVQSMKGGGGGGGVPVQQQSQGPPQGWNAQPPPPAAQAPMRYN